jgi:hypothetical protein
MKQKEGVKVIALRFSMVTFPHAELGDTVAAT